MVNQAITLPLDVLETVVQFAKDAAELLGSDVTDREKDAIRDIDREVEAAKAASS